MPADANDPTDVDNSWIQNPNVVESKANNLAAYVQDTWRIAPDPDAQPRAALGAAEALRQLRRGRAPRSTTTGRRALGFVWDFAGDGSSKVYGSWGYFHESIPMDIVIRSFGGEITAFIYNFHGALDDPNRTIVQCDPDTPRGCGNVTVGANTPVDPDLKGQYIEEFVLGADIEVAKDFVGGRQVRLARPRPGHRGRPRRRRQLPTSATRARAALRTTYDYDCSCYACPGATKPKRTFEGVELTARKRFSNNWQMIASYLWSKLEGNYDGTFQASTGQLDPNINSAYDYAEFRSTTTATCRTTAATSSRSTATTRSPSASTVGRLGVLTAPAAGHGLRLRPSATRNWELYLSERGAFGRTDGEYEADLHLGYPVELGGVEVNLLLDVFNLLDRQGETGRDQRYNLVEDYHVIDYDTGEALGPIRPGDTARPATNPAFNKASAWQDPRSIRLGVRITF